jgi:hypothetical protein
MSLARFAFQACANDHSDISPFAVKDLRLRISGKARIV